MKIQKKFYLFIILLIISGCALRNNQKEALIVFAQAADKLGNFASEEFPRLRNDTIDINIQNVILRGKAKYNKLESALEPEAVAARVAAARALENYGKLLQLLLQENDAEKLHLASMEFSDSLSQLPFKPSGFYNYDSVGGIVENIGFLFIEARKAKQIKIIIKEYKDDIDKICSLLINDFSKGNEGGDGFVSDFENTILKLKNRARAVLRNRKASFTDRKIAINAYKKYQDSQARINLIASSAKESINQLKAANAELEYVLEKQSFFDLIRRKDKSVIKEFKTIGKQLKGLSNAVKALSTN